MAEKILRITFNGISTLTPGLPPNGAAPKAFVLMASSEGRERTNAWQGNIEPHSPFIYVPESIQWGEIPTPADSVNDDKLGKCNIYFIDNARVTFYPLPEPEVHYYTDSTRQMGVRPGSENVASEYDMRWLMHINEILPEATLKDAANPARGRIEERQVAAVVELPGGTLKANFACKSAQPKTFASPGGRIEGFKRVLATEFFIEMKFKEETTIVSLRLDPLRGPEDLSTGVPGNALFLQWGDRTAIDVRMGNDTKDEARALRSFRRCDARSRDVNGRPVMVPRDDDFDLHYDMLEDFGTRPLPQSGTTQTQVDACNPAAVGSNG
ncbi:MAG TPA: hypothetical protein VNI54_15225 [Thermoanaerobaculia bacterium]|nr:hypothetical protein [Thermoanaerobaculia bacterium]